MSPHIKKDDEKVFPYWQLTVLGEFFKPARERGSHSFLPVAEMAGC
jgi:hypothetical protein